MPYNNVTSRVDIGPLIPEDVAQNIIQDATQESAVLARFRRVTMASAQQRLPVLSARPVAYFVNGDTGLKQTTEMAWANKFLNVEEIACIVPVPDAVLEDSAYDLWAEIRPFIVEAVARKLDAAVFFGVDAPASWPQNITAAAVAAGNTVFRGTASAGAGGIAEDINQLWSKVEGDGFDVNGHVAERTLRARIRGARGTDGQPLMDVNGNVDSILGVPITYAMSGLWPVYAAGPPVVNGVELFAGDFSQFMVGVRRDITIAYSDQAVITDATNAVVFNLWQQDMTAMRVTFRVAWQVANPMTNAQPVEANRYPVAVLRTNA